MGQVVLPSLISDIRRAYDAFFSSFEQDVMGRIMLGILFPGSSINDEEFRKAHAAGTLEYWHTTDHQYTTKCVDTQTGGIIGVGLHDVFLRERSTEERQNYGAPWLEGEHRERAEKIINPLWEMRESLFGGRPYICEWQTKSVRKKKKGDKRLTKVVIRLPPYCGGPKASGSQSRATIGQVGYSAQRFYGTSYLCRIVTFDSQFLQEAGL